MSNFNGLEITECQVYPVPNSERTAAEVRIVFNNVFIIQNIRIIKGKFGLFVSMPRIYDPNKKKGYSIAFPITEACQKFLSETILTEYNKILEVA